MSVQLEFFRQGDSWTPIGELEFLSLNQTVTSQAAGELTWSYETAVDAEFRYDHGDIVLLRGRDDDADDDSWTMLFRGRVSGSPERTMQSGRALDTVTAVDAWADLSVPFQRTVFSASAYNRSHVILFRDSSGERMTCGDQAKEILDYAISQGADIQYIASDLEALTVEPPADEVTDLTCAEALLKCLRLQMDVFTRFDYSTSPATIRFLDADSEVALSVDMTEVLTSGGSVTVKRNDDQALDGVVIYYEIENELIDGTTQEIQVDSYGNTSGKNVLVQTVSVEGSYVVNNDSSIDLVCRSWPTDWATNLAWVKYLFPGNDDYFCSIVDSGSEGGSPAVNYIESGYKEGYGVSAVEVTVWWDVVEHWVMHPLLGIPDYRVACGTWPSPLKITKRVSRSFLFTSSPSGNYESTEQIVVPGESIPTGVAEAIYKARHWPIYSGTVPQEITSTSRLASPQHNISLHGGKEELKDMRAPVQQVTRNWLAEIEQIKFGFPEQAGVSDFIDMLRANRSVSKPLRRTWKSAT
ncbi:hypothetical protein EGM51_10560 [Verrucomicrobia bacterium S94]|nr:hypothetical protein EGM51_10560 [Verrucomicrobia bacterium S94]